MFLKEALLRCSQLQQQTAAQYDALCDQSPGDDARAGKWRGAAARERRRAGFLEALAQLCTALEAEGPFLVQIPLQLEEIRRALDSAQWRRDTCTTHPGCTCAESLERVMASELYVDLIELAEPEVRRALRVIANELRNVRRTSDTAAPRRAVDAAAPRRAADADVPRREVKAAAACGP